MGDVTMQRLGLEMLHELVKTKKKINTIKVQ